MSVVDNKTVDGVALTDDKKGIILLITDHLEWKDEYQHLIMLQAKINGMVWRRNNILQTIFRGNWNYVWLI